MKKFLWLFVSILTLGLTLPNQVNAEVVVENFKETVEDEIKTMEALEKQYPDEYKEAGYGEYVDVLKKADFSNYQESDEKINVYVFRGSTCGYCLKAIAYFTSILPEYGQYFNLKTYEVWANSDNSELLENVAATLGDKVQGVPYIVIGDTAFPGYADTYNSKIEAKIKSEYESKDRYDVMQHLNNKKDGSSNTVTTANSTLLWVILVLQVVGISGLAGFMYSTNKENKEIYLSKITSLESKIDEIENSIKSEKTAKSSKTEKAKKETKTAKKTTKKTK